MAKKTRRVKQAQYKSLRLQKRIKHSVKLPSAYRLTKTAAQTLWRHKGLFAGITLVYGLLNLILVQGITGGTDVSELKDILSDINLGSLGSGLSIFVVMVGSAGNASSQTAGAYQVFLALIGSLAIIWALRQVLAGVRLRIRDSFYRGMYPLVPFILVLLVVGLQLIPLLIGSSLYSLVISNGIAVYFIEKLLWGLLYALLALTNTLHVKFFTVRTLYRHLARHDADESAAFGPRAGAPSPLDGAAQNPVPAGHSSGRSGRGHAADHYLVDAPGSMDLLCADHVGSAGSTCLYVHPLPGVAK